MSQFPPKTPAKWDSTLFDYINDGGLKFLDGYPVRLPNRSIGSGDYQTGDATWKYRDGELMAVWEPTSWNEQREVQYEAIVDQPLLLEDGTPMEAMFEGHIWWVNRWNKQEALRNYSCRDRRVAWFLDGKVIYTTTIGDLLDLSLRYGGHVEEEPVVEEPVEVLPSREDTIDDATRAYQGRRLKRNHAPYLRPLRNQAGMGDISSGERHASWERVG